MSWPLNLLLKRGKGKERKEAEWAGVGCDNCLISKYPCNEKGKDAKGKGSYLFHHSN